jgi:hypothetical protein
MKALDLTGNKYGRLTVIERAGLTRPGRHWLCLCDCGGEAVCSTNNLRRGISKSCGCYHRERAKEGATKHGYRGEKLNWVWSSMKQRCSNPNNAAYKNYGGRGIRVCDEWQEYAPFREWAFNNGYVEGLLLDRKNNNGNYEPKNCRWVTRIEQNRNKRSNRLITYEGKTMCATEWASELGVPSRLLLDRLNLRWNAKDTLTTKTGEGGRYHGTGNL